MKHYRFLLITFSILFSSPAICQTDSLNQIKPNQDSLAAADTSNINQARASGEIYKLNLAVDIPLTAISAGWALFAFTQIYSKDPSTNQQVLELDENDVPKFDRWAAGMSDPKADQVSDYFFYGSIPYAFTLLLSKSIRQDGLKIGFMYLEAMSVTGMLYTGSTYFVDRYRPEAYDTELPFDERKGGGMKNAFFAGHPALVATSTFFTASVVGAYHPKSVASYTAYGIAVVATGTTVYLRHMAGKHFPSDLIIGTGIGTLSGLLIPHFHKIRAGKDQKLGLYPYKYGKINGLTAIYKL